MANIIQTWIDIQDSAQCPPFNCFDKDVLHLGGVSKPRIIPPVPRVDAAVYPHVDHPLLVPHCGQVSQAVQAIAVSVPGIGHIQQPADREF